MSTIAVVDCGMGNLHSVLAGIARAEPRAQVHTTSDAAAIAAADKVVFPGDGNFGACMEQIDKRNLRDALRTAAAQKPFLGICVGMQVLFEGSEEHPAEGLGVCAGTVTRLPAGEGRKVPHIGWNTVRRIGSPAFTAGVAEGAYFYFVHSYCAPLGAHTALACEYGVQFCAALQQGQLFATQFHPEKSGDAGEILLRNFLTHSAEDAEAIKKEGSA